jgi:hypothetical protein
MRNISNFSKSKVLELIVFILGILTWLHYSIFGYDRVFNSDTAGFFTLAQTMQEHNSLIPREFYYANGDMPLSVNLIIYLLLKFTSPSMGLYALSNVILGAITLTSAYFFIRTFKLENTQTLALTGLLASGLSSSVNFFVFGQSSYGIVLACIFGTLAIVRSMDLTKSNILKASLAWGPVCFLFLQNPIRGFFWGIIPILIALTSLDEIKSMRFRFRRYKYGIFISAFFPMFLSTMLLRAYFQSQIPIHRGVLAATYLDPSNYLQNFAGAVNGLLHTIGASAVAGSPLFGGSGVSALTHLALYVALISFVVTNRFKISRYEKSLFVGFIFSFSFTLYQLGTTGLNTSLDSGRYLIPSFLVLFLGLNALAIKFQDRNSHRNAISLFYALLICSQLVSTIHLVSNTSPSYLKTVRELEYLKIKSISATFWNSNIITAASAGKVSSKTILLDMNTCLTPFGWIISSDKYLTKSDTVRLLLNQNEYAQFKEISACSPYIATSTTIEISEGFRVVSFENIGHALDI